MSTTLAEPGTILVSTWGYDQTNVDFYEVTRATQHTLWMRPLAKRAGEATSSMSRYVSPRPGEYVGAEMRRRPVAGASGLRVSIDSCSQAQAWDGKPVHETSWA